MTLRSYGCAVALIFVSSLVPSLRAEVRLPQVLASHMVVQRDRPVHVWGWARAGEAVTVSFRGASRMTEASELGKWSVYLQAGAAGGPFELVVKGDNTLTLDDVLVGDVWLAGGQSNMEFMMSQTSMAEVDLPKAANPRIRLLIVTKTAAEFAQSDVSVTPWAVASPESAKSFSAVAWYFAREIEATEHVPVGVIDDTWGGTVAEAWTSLSALGSDASLAAVFAVRGRQTDAESDALLDDPVRVKEIEEAKARGSAVPQFPWHPPLNMWGPGLLWNGMIAPLTPLPIRGVIWYQGETNSIKARNPELYTRVFPALIEDWRREWGIGDFPFLFVQISNFKSTALEDWPTIREAQRQTLKLRNTAMVVTIDIGNPDDVHPKDKTPVGHRLALAARALSYDESVEFSGPLFRQVTPEGAKIRIWFDHADGLRTKGGPLTGFEISGRDGKWFTAQAAIQGDSVILASDSVQDPVAARYGWANSPECHLYNQAGLPASPFTSAK